MRMHVGLRLLISLAVGSFLFPMGIAAAQSKPVSLKEYERLIYSVKGPDLYRAHCAACHGLDGKGGGTVAPALKAQVPDLTLLAKKNRGKFPAERVRKIISGDEPSLVTHGSREMPVWGPIFHQIENDRDFGNVRMQNLIRYLETIQQK
ncbi:MAG TPA: cytochrome c [Candidatus Dormibacteraeota bacterium]|nr:cytochrome c [Candidatus Dormibacteraeota bacterium]